MVIRVYTNPGISKLNTFFQQDGRPQVEEMYYTRSPVSLSIYFVLKYMRHLLSEDVEE